jgi:hypothetical protein
MAKTKANKGKGKSKQRAASRSVALPKRVLPGFDAAAKAYARLLQDPCNAPLVHPIGCPTGGILVRAQSITSLGSPTATAGVLHWTPGAIGLNNVELLTSSVLNLNTATLMAVSADAPGRAFLVSNASAVRCVAACAKIMWDGAESARAGRIAYGNSVGGFLDVGSTPTPGSIMPNLETMERMPQTKAEIRWCPNEFDLAYADPSVNTPQSEKDRRSALTVAAVSFPANTYVTIELTAVYEYLPVPTSGIALNTRSTTKSSATFHQVISAINAAAHNPWVQTAGQVLLAQLPTMGNSRVATTGFGVGGRRSLPYASEL